MAMKLNGTIVGYDPGGNSKHGVAFFSYDDGRLINSKLMTLKTADQVIDEALAYSDLIAIGIDTLTCWSTGISGWRPADRLLKKRYSQITNSISAANSLYGAMGLNGMAVLIALRTEKPSLIISETHPKVLHLELLGSKYNYLAHKSTMDEYLSKIFSTNITTVNDHEWDAALSVYVVSQGISGSWSENLHNLPCLDGERLIHPCGDTYYWWPN